MSAYKCGCFVDDWRKETIVDYACSGCKAAGKVYRDMSKAHEGKRKAAADRKNQGVSQSESHGRSTAG